VAYRQMGELAAEMVLDIRRGGEAPATTLLPPTLSIRASTVPS
jgi:DNA-binding LacI/PurR family transcriptional regulator